MSCASDTAVNQRCCPYHNPAPLCFEHDICGLEIVGLKGDECPRFWVFPGDYPTLGAGSTSDDDKRSLIHEAQGFTVALEWAAKGKSVRTVTGDWHYAVHLHRVDADAPTITTTGTVNMNVSVPEFIVNERVVFAPSTVPVGIYKLYVTVRFDIPGRAWSATAGFGKGPMIFVYPY